MKSSLVIVLSLLISGCATYYPPVSVEHFGEADPAKDQKITQVAGEIEQTPSDVKVYVGSLPDGLALSEQGSKITILPGYENKYSILGAVAAGYNKDPLITLKNFLWVPTFQGADEWRKWLCYPQAPIKLLTLGLWGYFSPTAWPCVAVAPSDELDRKRDLIDSLKKAAKAMGANAIAVSGAETTNITYVRNGAPVSASSINMTGMTGFAIVEK
jgi:hypothetical protein